MQTPTHTLRVGIILCAIVPFITNGLVVRRSADDSAVGSADDSAVGSADDSAVGSADRPSASLEMDVVPETGVVPSPNGTNPLNESCCGHCSQGRQCVPSTGGIVQERQSEINGTMDGTEDEECVCKCVLSQQDCDAEKQDFDSENCVCKCKSDEEESCIALDNHYYDEENCRCMCRTRRNRECSSGYEFDEEECGCIATF